MMTTPVPRLEDSWEANDRALLRRRLLHLALACLTALALLGLARSDLSDTAVAGASDGCGGWRDEVAQVFPGEVAKACRVLMCESGGDPGAVSPGGDHGLLQIRAKVWNKPHHPDPVAQFIGHHWGVVYDGWSNLVMAQKISHHYGWERMWACA